MVDLPGPPAPQSVFAPVAPILTEVAAVLAQIPLVPARFAAIAPGFGQGGTPLRARVGVARIAHVAPHFATVVSNLTPVGAHFPPILANLVAVVPG